MTLDVGVVTIRNGKTHELKDKNAILAGLEPLMTHDKVFFDVSPWDDNHMPLPVDPAEVKYELYYGDVVDLAFNGADVLADKEGLHWHLGNQGRQKLMFSKHGCAVVVDLARGTPGRTKAKLRVTVRDMVDEVVFPYVD